MNTFVKPTLFLVTVLMTSSILSVAYAQDLSGINTERLYLTDDNNTVNNGDTFQNDNNVTTLESSKITIDHTGTFINNKHAYITEGNTMKNLGVLDNRTDGVLAVWGSLYNQGEMNNNGFISIKSTGLFNAVSLTNTGEIENDGQLIMAGSVNNQGKIINNSQFTNNSFVFTNTGEITNNADLNNNYRIINKGLITNSGVFSTSNTLRNYNEVINNNVMTNSGDVTIYTKGSVTGEGSYTQTSGQTINNGVMTQTSVNIKGGSLSGTGTINSNVTVNGSSYENYASLTAGNSIGTMIINGNYTQGEFGSMVVEFDETHSDLLDVSGIASLAGVLSFEFIGDDVTEGTFNFLTFASIVGSFDSVILPSISGFNFELVFGDTFANLVVSQAVSAVPVPAALFLFGPALLGFLGLRRKANLVA
ncbi:MAG TPA: hypothetical protein EYM37_05630 [Methylophaga aminisulfidivorans]|uniref:hypothetical protein n=2 Tax=Piscirickettsiaceae TaxID=135616 RepID=UPI001A13BE08|nr:MULTISPECIES: hypothetical protein [Methylophaga]HIM39405.1 hypothetical protein [Methylophaga aminisulfidivorans]